MIFYDFKAGLNEKDSYKNYKNVFQDLLHLMQQFLDGLENLKERKRILKMSIAVEGLQQQLLKRMLKILEKIIKDDRHVTYQQIQQSLEISAGSVKKF